MSQQRNNQQSEKVGAAWEKIFSYHVSDTGLVQFNTQNPEKPDYKMGNGPEQVFFFFFKKT